MGRSFAIKDYRDNVEPIVLFLRPGLEPGSVDICCDTKIGCLSVVRLGTFRNGCLELAYVQDKSPGVDVDSIGHIKVIWE